MSLHHFVESLPHPSELLALLTFSLLRPSTAVDNPAVNGDGSVSDPARFTTYALLNETARSFSPVIKALDDELMDPICSFYSVLRAMDTVEDDMTLPLERKVKVMRNFHQHIYERGWRFTESGPQEKDRRILLEFDSIIEHFLSLKPKYQKIIANTTRLMGDALATYREKRVESTADYYDYCYSASGMFGIGLSEMFSVSGLEGPQPSQRTDLSKAMGEFLQKTNIIRDLFKDHHEGRHFWPREVWSQYVDNFEDLFAADKQSQALACLNHLCLDALQHIPDVIAYLSLLENRSVFLFCAIPQVLAISTLTLLYNNPGVFSGNVKIRKGMAVKLIMQAESIDRVRLLFNDCLDELACKNAVSGGLHFASMSSMVVHTQSLLQSKSDGQDIMQGFLPNFGILVMLAGALLLVLAATRSLLAVFL